MSLLAELRRRKVFRVGGAYLVVAWLLVQVVATLSPLLQLPDWVPRLITLLLMLGLPIALVMAWVFEVTPEGLKVEVSTVGNKRVLTFAALLAAVALGWFARGVPGPEPPSRTGVRADGPRAIAVLPFASRGEDAESSGLAGGLHDTLITQLSKLRGLEVRSRISVMKYREWSGGLKAVADELMVDVLLEGSVQRIGNRTVVNARLVDARSDANLWAETIDRSGDDLFALQADIARRVTSELQVALSPEEHRALTEAPTRDHQAYALYVQGMQTFTGASLAISEQEAERKRAADLLRAALARDPEFALAWAALTNVLATIAWDTRTGDYRALGEQARAAGVSALAFGKDLPEARYAIGAIRLQLDLDPAGALPDLEYSAEQMPNVARIHFMLGIAYRMTGRWEDYLRSARRALQLEPTATRFARTMQSALLALRRWDEYEESVRAQAALHPDLYVHAHDLAMWESVQAGSLAPLKALVVRSRDRFPEDPQLIEDIWLVSMAGGEAGIALAALDRGMDDERIQRLRGDALHALGRVAEATAAYTAARDLLLEQLAGDRDPFVEADILATLAYLHARLGDSVDARAAIARADFLWGHARDPADGGRIWAQLLPAHAALGEFEAACAKVEVLVKNPSYFPAGRLWIDWNLAELHPQPCFRALMHARGVDVNRAPFRAIGAAAAPGG